MVSELTGIQSFIRRSALHAQVCSTNMKAYYHTGNVQTYCYLTMLVHADNLPKQIPVTGFLLYY